MNIDEEIDDLLAGLEDELHGSAGNRITEARKLFNELILKDRIKTEKYNYKVDISCWDETHYQYLRHKKKFTEEEFYEMVAESFVKAYKLDQELKKSLSLNKSNVLLEEEGFEEERYHLEDHFDAAMKILINMYGFEKLEVEQICAASGTSTFLDTEEEKVPTYDKLLMLINSKLKNAQEADI